MTPELQQQISIWRQQAEQGTLTIEEMKKVVIALREGRRTAGVSPEKATRAKAKAAIPSADDMLNELGNI